MQQHNHSHLDQVHPPLRAVSQSSYQSGNATARVYPVPDTASIDITSAAAACFFTMPSKAILERARPTKNRPRKCRLAAVQWGHKGIMAPWAPSAVKRPQLVEYNHFSLDFQPAFDYNTIVELDRVFRGLRTNYEELLLHNVAAVCHDQKADPRVGHRQLRRPLLNLPRVPTHHRQSLTYQHSIMAVSISALCPEAGFVYRTPHRMPPAFPMLCAPFPVCKFMRPPCSDDTLPMQ